MAACSHGSGYSSCPPAKVSSEFNQADKGSSLLHHAMSAMHKHSDVGTPGHNPMVHGYGKLK